MQPLKREVVKMFKIDKEIYTLTKVQFDETSKAYHRVETPENSFGYIDIIHLNHDLYKKPFLTSQRYHKPKVLKRCKTELLKVEALVK